jgi:hypothetical protein
VKRPRGSKQADALQAAILDLLGDFDRDCTGRGLSAQLIDAHISAILIDVLHMVVTERETLSAETLIDATTEILHDSGPAYDH